jgi:chromosome segregation ATPase
LFSNKNYSFLFESVMRVYRTVVPSLQQRINNIVELISDIRDPTAAQTLTQAQKEMESAAAARANQTIEPVQAPQQQAQTAPAMSTHQLQMKISQLKFQRLKLKDDFDNVYKEIKNVHSTVDMTRLSELRKQIAAVEEEIANLTATLNGGNVASNTAAAQPAEAVPPSVEAAPAQSAAFQEEEPFDPIEAAHHCLKLAVCLLKDPELKSLPPQIRSLCDTLIITNISSVNEHIRAVAVKALNLGRINIF